MNATFGPWGEDQLFKWKYADNPFGESLHTLAYDGRQAVGCVGFWRNDIDESNAYQCVDLAVLPSHRRRGIFKDAVASSMEHLGGAFVYTFPGGGSRSGFLQSGWQIKRRIRVSAQLTRFVLRRHEGSSPLADEYIQWRFVDHPSKQYFVSRLNGRPYLVTQRRNNAYAVAGALSHDFGLPEVSPRFLFSYDFLHLPFVIPGKGDYILENSSSVSYDGYIPSYRADTF